LGGDEPVDLVDTTDAVIGASTVRECVERGLLHRAVAVIVVRKGGKILLQERSRKDLWQPGMWTLSSTGHVRKGESYESAAVRELREELGLTAPVTNVGKRLLSPIREGELTEHEWVSLFEAQAGGKVTMDPVEVESVKEFSGPELSAMSTNGKMTPDAVILLDDYLRSKRLLR
jgi:isopentenyldiphosphate isomerase